VHDHFLLQHEGLTRWFPLHSLFTCIKRPWQQAATTITPTTKDAATVTPWKTHLAGEEYEPDARALEDLAREAPNGTEWTAERIAAWGLQYLGIPNTTTNEEVVDMLHPYNYGYPWEAKVGADDEGCFIEDQRKHMAMGAPSPPH
jgi:hypothetical protein